MPNSDSTIRKNIKLKRSVLSLKEQEKSSYDLLSQFHHSPWRFCGPSIAIYLPFRGEIDPWPMINNFWQKQTHVYLPCIAKNNNNKYKAKLQFKLYQPHSTLKANSFNIMEPINKNSKIHWINLTKRLSVVFCPLVAVDLNGNRLGMGAGYYDKTFDFLLRQKHNRPKLIGLAYDWQLITTQKFTPKPWDIPLNGLITDKQYITF